MRALVETDLFLREFTDADTGFLSAYVVVLVRVAAEHSSDETGLFSREFTDADTGFLSAYLVILVRVAAERSDSFLSRSAPTTLRRPTDRVDVFLSPLADTDAVPSDDGGFFTL